MISKSFEMVETEEPVSKERESKDPVKALITDHTLSSIALAVDFITPNLVCHAARGT